ARLHQRRSLQPDTDPPQRAHQARARRVAAVNEIANQEGRNPMNRFKRTATFVAVFALGTLAAGTSLARAAQLEPVTLPGTGDSQDLLRALAQNYTAELPDRTVVVPNSTGSDGGIKVVGTGESP